MDKSIYTSDEYLNNNPTWHVEDSQYKAEKILNILDKNNLNFKNVCEIGCGAGEILKHLQEHFPPEVFFTGYDISSNAISLAKKNQNKNLVYYNGDLLQTNQTFDLLLMLDVFEHVDNYIGFLKSAKEKARYHIFHVPLDMTVQKILRVDTLLYARKKVGHLHYFNKETALETIKDTGYKIIDWQYTPWGFEMPQKQLLKKIMSIPQKVFYYINKDWAIRLMGGASIIILAKNERL